MKQNTEFENFNRTMHKLVKVPHAEIKAKLEAEKVVKKKRRERANDNRDKDHNPT